jgi:VCBS repeat-containing protein
MNTDQPVSNFEATDLSNSEAANPTDNFDLSVTASPELQLRSSLEQEIVDLKSTKTLLQQQIEQLQGNLGRLVQESLGELQQRKQNLQIAVEQLERRQERIQLEMRKSFAGVSQDLAIRVQGFKDYLVNSLQDLVVATEQLDLVPEPQSLSVPSAATTVSPAIAKSGPPQFTEQAFQEQSQQIRKLIDQYRTAPNYYGQPWQLRRTFEPIHAERVATWFFSLGGRGALRAMSSRLQNILIAATVVSILRHLHGDRLRILILANSPERLGDWRRGLQDCLGITRTDVGPDRGVGLFESPESLAQKADRLVKEDLLPLILIDDSEESISLAILQYPLWLAFAPEPQLRPSRTSTFDFFE